MFYLAGSNQKDIKQLNRNVVMKLLFTSPRLSRSDLTRLTGLTAMTITNIVSELMDAGLVVEYKESNPKETSGVGRRPVLLELAPKSPVLCGVYISRRRFTMIISDLKAHELFREEQAYPETLEVDWLYHNLADSYRRLKQRCRTSQRRILCVGIVSIGPVDTQRGIILNPPNFGGLRDLPVCRWMEEIAGGAACLLNESSACALAESLSGKGVGIDNVLYVYIHEGIGAGMVLGGELYQGVHGYSPELGHTTIDFHGPLCPCGSRGCLELYADESKTVEKAAGVSTRDIRSFADVMAGVQEGDQACLAAAREFASYLGYALRNALNLYEFSTVILGYETIPGANILESMLAEDLGAYLRGYGGRRAEFVHTEFLRGAPLTGAIALGASKVFTGSLPMLKEKG